MSQFNVVIGNPPYQDPEGARNRKVWMDFYEKTTTLLKQDGWLGYITPTTAFWGLDRPWQTGRVSEHLLHQTSIQKVDFTISNAFPQVGDIICRYNLIHTEPTGELVEVTTTDCGLQLLKQDDIYDTEDRRRKAKFFSAMRRLRERFGKYPIIYDNRPKDELKPEKDEIYQFPVYVSAAQPNWYSATPCLGYRKNKVIVNMSSYWWNENSTDKYMRYDTEVGVGNLGRLLFVKDEEEAESIMSFFTSPVVKYFIAANKITSPWNHAMYQLPQCHHLSEDELLEEIGITREEFYNHYPSELERKV